MVRLWSQGVNQSSAGTDEANSIVDVHLATGRIGTPGAGPFSVTGQPSAMGGRCSWSGRERLRPRRGPPPSPTVCACHPVREATTRAAIADSAARVGEVTQAGTNCGACRPEIAALLAKAPVSERA